MRRWLAQHIGLRMLAFILALLLWIYVQLIETGTIALVSPITQP